LRNLIVQVGVSQIVVGTDYAFDMGDYDGHELIESLTVLSEEDRVNRIIGMELN
jgi:aminocarboxymuconate-semialdehyde decarboxylase